MKTSPDTLAETLIAEPIPNAALVVRYDVDEADIARAKADYATLAADTPKGYEAVRKAIAHVRDTRVYVEKTRVALKADALDYGRRVDSEAKRLTALLVEIEEPLKAKKKAVDDEKERVKREAEEAQRAALAEAIRKEEEAKLEEARKQREADEAKLAEERAAIAAEQAKLAEANAALEAERAKLAEERAAAEREAKARQDEADAKAKAEADALAKQRAEVERAEREHALRLKVEEETRARVERERAADEAARVAREKREAEAKARADAMRPDAEKLRAFEEEVGSHMIDLIRPMILASPEANKALRSFVEDVDEAGRRLREFCDSAAPSA